MDWDKVAKKLRAASDQHAQNAQTELLRGNKQTALRQQDLSEIFYGLAAAFEAGVEQNAPEKIGDMSTRDDYPR